ncbi:hypothetical protein SteCoe_4850 [Stentor coeruleus]|uniref:Uncharacterized protein n=1 Tax=Stentor coeruleus TaxID=5963 RepID=A0A1R2CTV6_9CILI|nr:hypothetical protein SteCoe_4850 [Stentor coeruleus]
MKVFMAVFVLLGVCTADYLKIVIDSTTANSVKGNVFLMSINDTILDITGTTIYMYLNPSSTIESDYYKGYSIKGVMYFYHNLWCAGIFNLIASSKNYTNGISDPITITRDSCYPMTTKAFETPSKQLFKFEIDLRWNYNGELIDKTSFNAYELYDENMTGMTFRPSTNGYTMMHITFNNIGLKKILFVGQYYYSIYIEVNVTALDSPYLALIGNLSDEYYTGEIINDITAVAYFDQGFNQVDSEGNYSVEAVLDGHWNYTGGASKNMVNGTTVFNDLRVLVEGYYELLAISPGLQAGYSSQFSVYNLGINIFFPDGPPSISGVAFNLKVDVLYKNALFTKKSIEVSLGVTSGGTLSGITSNFTYEGSVFFTNLRILSVGDFRIIATASVSTQLSEVFKIYPFVDFNFPDKILIKKPFPVTISLYKDTNKTYPFLSNDYNFAVTLMPGGIFIGSYSNMSSGELHIPSLIALEPISYNLLFVRGSYVIYSQEIIPKLYVNATRMVNDEDKTLVDLSTPIFITGQLFYDSLYEYPYNGVGLYITFYLETYQDFMILENTMTINGTIYSKNFTLNIIGDSHVVISGKYIFNQTLNFTGKGYLKITGDFNGIKDPDSEISFLVSLYKDPDFTHEILFCDCDFVLKISNNGEISNWKCRTTENNEAEVINLRVLSDGEYYFIISSNMAINIAHSDIFSIEYTKKVMSLFIQTDQLFLRIGEPLHVTVELYSFDDMHYKDKNIGYLISDNLKLKGITTKETNIGVLKFTVYFDNIGVTSLTARCEYPSKYILYPLTQIIVYDNLCSVPSLQGCENCVFGAVKDGISCLCKNNRKFYNIEQGCICDEGFLDINEECVNCKNYILDSDITAYYTEDFTGIIIEFDVVPENITFENCSDLFILPNSLKTSIISCEWTTTKSIFLTSNITLHPVIEILSFNQSLISNTKPCTVFQKYISTSISIIYPLPVPKIDIFVPLNISIPCINDDIKLFTKYQSSDYIYNWTIKNVDNGNNLIVDEGKLNSSEVILSKNTLKIGVYKVTLKVVSIIFETYSIQSSKMNIDDNITLTVDINVGNKVKITAEDYLFIQASVFSLCGLEGQIIYSWEYISSEPLNVTSILKSSSDPSALIINPFTFNAKKTYNFIVLVSLNSSQGTGSGKGELEIEVFSDDINIELSRSSGLIGLNEDFIISGKVSNSNTENITFSWSCIQDQSSCLDNYGNKLIQNPESQDLIIKKQYLTNGAIYKLTFIAKSDQVSVSKNVEIQVDSRIKGIINLGSIENPYDISKPLTIIPQIEIPDDGVFIWTIDPEINTKSFLLNQSYIQIPSYSFNENMNYKITLNVSSQSFIDLSSYINIETKFLPICDNLTSTLSSNKFLLKANNCYSKYSQLTYKFGFIDNQDIVYWKTSNIFSFTVTLYPQDLIQKAIVKVCDSYGCNNYNCDLKKSLRILSENSSLVEEINNHDTIPDVIMHYLDYPNMSIFNIILNIFYDYFKTEPINESVLNIFLACISSIAKQANYFSKSQVSIFSDFVINKINLYRNLIDKAELKEILSYLGRISKFMSLDEIIEFAQLIDLNYTSNLLPGDEIYYIGNLTYYKHRNQGGKYAEFYKVFDDFEIKIVAGDYLSELSVYDVCFISFWTPDIIFNLNIYKSGIYTKGVFKVQDLMIMNLSDINYILLTLKDSRLVLSDYYECFYLEDNNWKSNGCRITHVEAGKFDILIEKGSTFKLAKVMTWKNKPFISFTIGIILALALVLGIFFAIFDRKREDEFTAYKYIQIFSISSLFVKQRPMIRSFTIIELETISITLLAFIGILEYTTNLSNYTKSIKHISLLNGFISLCITQFISISLSIIRIHCFIRNSWKIIGFVICGILNIAAIGICVKINSKIYENLQQRWVLTFIVYFLIEVFVVQGLVSGITRLGGKEEKTKTIKQREESDCRSFNLE